MTDYEGVDLSESNETYVSPYERMVWTDHVGRGVTDPYGPDGPEGGLIQASTDRRWLWHLEAWLAVRATNDDQHTMQLALYKYLCETCEHEWRYSEGDEDMPEHRQCLWCHVVHWKGEPEYQAA